MKSISRLKDDARKHEQREEWEKAIAVYLEVLRIGDEGEAEVELSLYNRIGDLCVRLGREGEAVGYYAQAADRYADAGLYNNAIALCNKALRYDPDRLQLMKKLGQFSASQGFITDARRYFLEYAERQFAAKQVDDALQALEDFANVSDDADIRELLGRRLEAHGRTDQAVRELRRAHAIRQRAGDHEDAARLREEILALDPSGIVDEEVPEDAVEPSEGPAAPFASDADGLPELLEIDSGAERSDAAFELPAGEAAAPLEGLEPTGLAGRDDDAAGMPGLEVTGFGGPDDFSLDEVADVGGIEGLEPTSLDFGSAAADLEPVDPGLELEHDETSFDLPLLDEEDATEAPSFELPALDEEDAGEEVAFELPLLDEEDARDEPSFELPMLDEEDPADAQSFELPVLDETPAAETSPDETWQSADFDPVAEEAEGLELRAAEEPIDDEAEPLSAAEALQPDDLTSSLMDGESADDAEPLEPLVEDAPQAEQAQAEAEAEAEAEAGTGDDWMPDMALPPGAGAARTPSVPPPAEPEGGFIDLGALLAEDEPESTRFRVQETAPTGDEDRDFAELLSQFKAKISEHVPAEDAAAHYDLGLAFKEMGLVDEAIAEFQVALRAGNMRLKVHEELGQCFLQKEQYNIAEKVLRRALEMPYDDELELLGVYYHLGRAYEGMDRREQARDAYERVLGMDINFQDVAARLAQL